MRRVRQIAVLLIIVAVAATALRGKPPRRSPVQTHGYQILAADFHVHSFPGDTAFIAPWDEMLEAQRVHLDVIALTSHNHTWSGQVGAWLSRFIDGPLIIPGEEIVGLDPHYHMLALGIHSTIDWRNSASEAIDQIHAQGGVAIAAHPQAVYWPTYDPAARAKLDGAEVLHPGVFIKQAFTQEYREFFASGHFAAIGDSDYRGNGVAGICRTYVFVRHVSELEVLDAVREHHTVVYDRGQFFGDPELIALLQAHRALLHFDEVDGQPPASSRQTRVGGEVGLLLWILLGVGGFHARDRSDRRTAVS
jgi:hypothetical protein